MQTVTKYLKLTMTKYLIMIIAYLIMVLNGMTLSITGSDTKSNRPAKFTRAESMDNTR